MKRKRNQANFGYGGLEGRKLLAADLGLSFTVVDMIDASELESIQGFVATDGQFGHSAAAMPGELEMFQFDYPEGFEIAFDANSISSFELDIEQMAAVSGDRFLGHSGIDSMTFEVTENDLFPHSLDADAFQEMLGSDFQFEFGNEDEFVIDVFEFDGEFGESWEMDGDWSFEFPGMTEGFEGESSPEFDVINIEGELFDLSDGSDGAFGTLNSENLGDSYSFFAHRDGAVSVVLASTAEPGEITATLLNEAGEEVEATSSDTSSSFTKLSFNVAAGQIYELAVAGTEGAEGEYQLTVSFDAAAAVDQHADEIGAEATALDLSEGFAEISGLLETEGDVDVFQLEATEGSQFKLFASELDSDTNSNLEIAISNANGDSIAKGATNADLSITFEADEAGTYFVSVSAGIGQTGAYQVAVVGEFNPENEDVVDLDDDDVAVDEELETDVDSDPVDESESDDSEEDGKVETDEKPKDSPLSDLEKSDRFIVVSSVLGDKPSDSVVFATKGFDGEFDSVLTLAEAIIDAEMADADNVFLEAESVVESFEKISMTDIVMVEMTEATEFDLDSLADFTSSFEVDSEETRDTDQSERKQKELVSKDEVLAAMFTMIQDDGLDSVWFGDAESEPQEIDSSNSKTDVAMSLVDNQSRKFWFEELQI